jgi:ATP adenylyltransferase
MSGNEKLWAPWRVKYVTKPDDDSSKCIFCEKSASDQDEENYVLCRRENAFVLLNTFPYNNGHVMVAELVEEFVGKIKKEMNPHGFNIGMNMGRTAGAGFEHHLHIHIVPRWNGDTNFMPVIGNTDIISESLDSVYKKLRSQNTAT